MNFIECNITTAISNKNYDESRSIEKLMKASQFALKSSFEFFCEIS